MKKLSKSQLRTIINESIWDFIKRSTAPREKWTSADGMQHADMAEFHQGSTIEEAGYTLAKLLIAEISRSASGWTGPNQSGILAKYEPENWLKIEDERAEGILRSAIDKAPPHVISQRHAVLKDWAAKGYIVMKQPQAIQTYGKPDAGIWLDWSGYQEMLSASSHGSKTSMYR